MCQIIIIAFYKDENKNFNLLSDDELEKVKIRMDVNFQANQLTKEDEGFKYDTREEFNPTVPSGWDTDDSFWFIFYHLSATHLQQNLNLFLYLIGLSIL